MLTAVQINLSVTATLQSCTVTSKSSLSIKLKDMYTLGYVDYNIEFKHCVMSGFCRSGHMYSAPHSKFTLIEQSFMIVKGWEPLIP